MATGNSLDVGMLLVILYPVNVTMQQRSGESYTLQALASFAAFFAF
jgi:hypothetical protein